MSGGGGTPTTTQTSTATSTPTPGPGQAPLLGIGSFATPGGESALAGAGQTFQDLMAGGAAAAPWLGPSYTAIDEQAARQKRSIDVSVPPGGQREQMKNNVDTQAAAQKVNTENAMRMQGLKGTTSLGEYLLNAAMGAYQPLAWAGGTTGGTVNVTQPGGSKFGF
jgi:hypothetical protein